MPNANANPNPNPDPPLMRQTLPSAEKGAVLLSGKAGRAAPSKRQAVGLLEWWVAARPHGRRGHGGGGELDSPCPFGRAAGLVEEQDSPLVAAAVAIVGRAEDGDNVLVVAPGVPG